MTNLSLLKSNPIFKSLTDDEITALLKLTETRTFKKNELVFSANDEARSFYVVESGSFLLTLQDRENKILKTGDLFGEIGVINEQMRTGSIRAIERSSALVFVKARLIDPELLDIRIALKLLLALAKNVTNYLKSRHNTSTKNIIEEGEDEFVEFKSTLRFNLYTGKNDKAMEQAVLKTVAAFMNTKGGTLLVGVSDDGGLLGLEEDKFKNEDKMLLHLNALIQTHISTIHTEFLLASVDVVDNRPVLRIDCEPATTPAYVNNGNDEYFYVRSGPSTVNLRVSEIYAYIKSRFGDIGNPNA